MCLFLCVGHTSSSDLRPHKGVVAFWFNLFCVCCSLRLVCSIQTMPTSQWLTLWWTQFWINQELSYLSPQIIKDLHTVSYRVFRMCCVRDSVCWIIMILHRDHIEHVWVSSDCAWTCIAGCNNFSDMCDRTNNNTHAHAMTPCCCSRLSLTRHRSPSTYCPVCCLLIGHRQ